MLQAGRTFATYFPCSEIFQKTKTKGSELMNPVEEFLNEPKVQLKYFWQNLARFIVRIKSKKQSLMT